MRILYIYRYLIIGGVTTQLINRYKYLQKFCEVHFSFFKDLGGRVIFPDSSKVFVLANEEELSGLINKYRYDVVIVIDTPEVYEVLTTSFKGLLVNEVHTTTKNIYYLSQLPFDSIDTFIVPSEYLLDVIRDDFHLENTNVPTIKVENCVDTSLFNNQELSEQTEKRIILWVGKLDGHKNWKLFLEITKNLTKLRNDVEFWIVGGVTASDTTALEFFETIEKYNILNKTKWFQKIDYRDMNKFYSLANKSGGLTVSTSSNESFGMTIIESLSCRCPVMAYPVGAIPEILKNDLSSCLFNSNDPMDNAIQISAFLDNNTLRSRISDYGEDYVNTYFNINYVGRKYLDKIQEILRAKNNSGV